jgi:hypothetical protein
MAVKSDRPIRPGGCSWRKITSRLHERDEFAENLGDVAAINFINEKRIPIRRIVLGALGEASQYAWLPPFGPGFGRMPSTKSSYE